MKHVTIVLYRQHPLAGEGNDNRTFFQSLKLHAHACEEIQEKAERVALKIAERYHCHAQVWDITKA